MQWDSPIKIKGFPGRSLRGCGGLVSSYPTEPIDNSTIHLCADLCQLGMLHRIANRYIG